MDKYREHPEKEKKELENIRKYLEGGKLKKISEKYSWTDESKERMEKLVKVLENYLETKRSGGWYYDLDTGNITTQEYADRNPGVEYCRSECGCYWRKDVNDFEDLDGDGHLNSYDKKDDLDLFNDEALGKLSYLWGDGRNNYSDSDIDGDLRPI